MFIWLFFWIISWWRYVSLIVIFTSVVYESSIYVFFCFWNNIIFLVKLNSKFAGINFQWKIIIPFYSFHTNEYSELFLYYFVSEHIMVESENVFFCQNLPSNLLLQFLSSYISYKGRL